MPSLWRQENSDKKKITLFRNLLIYRLSLQAMWWEGCPIWRKTVQKLPWKKACCKIGSSWCFDTKGYFRQGKNKNRRLRKWDALHNSRRSIVDHSWRNSSIVWKKRSRFVYEKVDISLRSFNRILLYYNAFRWKRTLNHNWNRISNRRRAKKNH